MRPILRAGHRTRPEGDDHDGDGSDVDIEDVVVGQAYAGKVTIRWVLDDAGNVDED